MSGLIIVGAGGLGLEVVQYARDAALLHPDLCPVGYIDDTISSGTIVNGLPVLGKTGQPIEGNHLYVIAVGNAADREVLYLKLREMNAQMTTLIHPLAYVAPDATINVGCIVAPFSFIGSRSTVGYNCFINAYGCIGHEAVAGDHSVLAPRSTLSGRSILGVSAFLGAHSCVLPGIKIGDRAKIAAASVVYSDVPPATLAIGNPAAWRAS